MSSQNTYQQGGSTSSSQVGIEKRRAAPYGQACLHCFKTKSKCVRQSSLDSCERCIRLKKLCSPADSLRKRSAQKPSNTTATIANLQAQIEDLKRRVPYASESASHAALPDLVKRSTGEYEFNKAKSEEKDDHLDSTPTSTTSDWELSPAQEQQRLRTFRTKMLKFFPFMHLPEGLSAEQLQDDKGFLFRAIMTVTSPSTQEKRARAKELKRELALKSVIDTKTDLDLLLGILTYVAWGYDHFIFSLQSPSRFTQLAISMAYDLRLNTTKSNLLPDDALDPNQQAPDQVLESIESKRAVLGCFMLSSQCVLSSDLIFGHANPSSNLLRVAYHYGQMEPMRWTPQLEEHLSAISRSPYCPTDEMFAWQIRLQLLVQQAKEQRNQRELDHYLATNSATAGTKDPLLHKWYFETLQGKLKELIASIPPHLNNDVALLTQIHFTLLNICESIHPVNPDIKPPNPSLNITTALDQRDIQFHSLQAIRAFFEDANRFSAEDYTGFSIMTWAQRLLNVKVLGSLSLNPLYRDEVRRTVDIAHELHCGSEKLKQASRILGETKPEDVFSKLFFAVSRARELVILKLDSPPQFQQHMNTAEHDVSLMGGQSFGFSGSDSGVEISPPNLDFFIMQQVGLEQYLFPGMQDGTQGIYGDPNAYQLYNPC
ncbi:hypothetical protein BJY04DRAFT_193832 [Aspergillus karnatakaensis]|uniref:Zn(II)2Cys6 transcription factor domain-containing protein n=1 Tax=Aspergillus karnatakaensis TaxID=1810916 RepID=UPI003CCCE060